MLNATGEKDEPEAIRLRKARFSDLTVQDEELLTEESVLGNELSFTLGKVSRCGKHNRVVDGLGEMEESPFESRDETVEERAEPVEKVGHGVRPLERPSKTI